MPAASGSGRCSPWWRRVSGPHPDAEEVIVASAVVELIHLATLYHDDVMDEADLRRGRQVRQRPLGQLDRHPDRRLPVRARLAAGRRPRAGRGADHRRDVRRAGHRADPGDRRRRDPDDDPIAHHLQRAGREDRLADRHLRPVRRDVLRGAATSRPRRCAGTAGPSGMAFQISDDIIDIASTDSGKTPGHRPAGGRPDPAGALHAGRSGRRPAAARAGLRTDHVRRGTARGGRRC